MIKLNKLGEFFLERISEPTTWQAIGFILTLFGSRFGMGVDWGQGAALGGLVSAFIKMVTKG